RKRWVTMFRAVAGAPYMCVRRSTCMRVMVARRDVRRVGHATTIAVRRFSRHPDALSKSIQHIEVNAMLTRVTRAASTTITLPGRTLQAYLRADQGISPRISVHTASFPPGSKPDGHTHAAEEEAIYVLSGRGRIVTPDGVAELEPGVFVLIHPGTFHATE